MATLDQSPQSQPPEPDAAAPKDVSLTIECLEDDNGDPLTDEFGETFESLVVPSPAAAGGATS